MQNFVLGFSSFRISSPVKYTSPMILPPPDVQAPTPPVGQDVAIRLSTFKPSGNEYQNSQPPQMCWTNQLYDSLNDSIPLPQDDYQAQHAPKDSLTAQHHSNNSCVAQYGDMAVPKRDSVNNSLLPKCDSLDSNLTVHCDGLARPPSIYKELSGRRNYVNQASVESDNPEEISILSGSEEVSSCPGSETSPMLCSQPGDSLSNSYLQQQQGIDSLALSSKDEENYHPMKNHKHVKTSVL